MAVYELKNKTMAIKVNSCGAELRSLKNLSTGTEYLWQADPEFWDQTSPVLFPFVGGLQDGKYRINGKAYSMPKHGFVMDKEFEMVFLTEDEIWFAFTSNQETLEIYPYEFVLKLGYRLLEDGVKALFQVENPGKEELYFSIGGHPAFNCPIEAGKKQTDYQIHFDTPEEISSTQISDHGLAADGKDIYPLQNGYLALTENMFDHDALIVENYQAKEISLCNETGKPYVTVTLDSPVFGIWSPAKKNAPFICIEPWHGLCDRDNYDGELKNRKWENSLAPGNLWKREYTIQCK